MLPVEPTLTSANVPDATRSQPPVSSPAARRPQGPDMTMPPVVSTPKTDPSAAADTWRKLPWTWAHALPVHWYTMFLLLTPQIDDALPTEICINDPLGSWFQAMPFHR